MKINFIGSATLHKTTLKQKDRKKTKEIGEKLNKKKIA